MSKPCGTSIGHDGCGYIFVYADHTEEAPDYSAKDDKATAMSSIPEEKVDADDEE